MAFELGTLINLIKLGQVVPFIGNELCILKDTRNNDEEITIENFLAEKLAEFLKIPYDKDNQRLRDIAFEAEKRNLNVISLIRGFYNNIAPGKLYTNYKFKTDNFERLARIKEFTTFLSASFTDVLKNTLIDIRGPENVIVINYTISKVSLQIPKVPADKTLVINLLGSATEQTEFAVTDEQHLEFFYNITSSENNFDKIRGIIVERTNSNVFLYLGCNFPDSFNRYLVRSITQTRYSGESVAKNIFIDIPPMNSKEKAFFQKYRSDFVNQDEILEGIAPGRLNGDDIVARLLNLFYAELEPPEPKEVALTCKVFLSYYWEDETYVASLQRQLNIMNVNNWRDKSELTGGPNQAEIEKQIAAHEIFMPLISNKLLDKISSSSNEKDAPYSARVEWPFAIGKYNAFNSSDKYGGKNSFTIIPILIDVQWKDERIPKVFGDNAAHQYPLTDGQLLKILKSVCPK
jgi:hypothetical protein